MSPEVRLLLVCVRNLFDTTGAPHPYIKDVLQQHRLDWSYLIDLAGRHGVLPLFYHGVSTACPEDIPRAVLLCLHRWFHLNARYNEVCTGELLTIVHLLQSHAIAAIPYKGPLLALSLYDDVALRQFGDLDILVHHWDIPKARDVLIATGYRLDQEETGPGQCVLCVMTGASALNCTHTSPRTNVSDPRFSLNFTSSNNLPQSPTLMV